MGETSSDPAVVIAIFAALTYDIISATNSSPQTTEINAAARADTLMKWVHIGLAQAVLFAFVGVFTTRGAKWPPLAGSGLAGGLLYVQYLHAKQSGLESSEPGTESY